MPNNELYLVVLPLIHISNVAYIGGGLTEQVLTLLPNREFATEFFTDEVDGFIATLQNREKYLIGGHVVRYEVSKIDIGNNRAVVKVIQHVAE